MEKFSEKYEETMAYVLQGKLLSDLPRSEANAARKTAREEAFRVAPELELDLLAYQDWLQRKRYRGGSSEMTAQERRGAKVLNRMGQICLKKFHPLGVRNKKREITPQPVKVSPSTTLTLTQKYLAWIKEHDTVPSDDTLSFFLGCVNTNWSNARREAKGLGYEFERVDGGMWQVTSRPLPEVQDLDETEKDRLLRKVLAMPDLSDQEVISILRKLI